MILFQVPAGVIDAGTRAQWLTPPFDASYTYAGGPDIMAAIVAWLAATPAVVSAFGHSVATPKLHADTIDPGSALPYLLYSETDEAARRVLGGKKIGMGSFELGVFDVTKLGARQKLELVRSALDAMTALVSLGDGGLLFYLRSQDNSGRTLESTAPGGGVTEYGRTMKYSYKVSRLDP